MSGRYVPLRHYLKLQRSRQAELTLSFRQIEGILGDGLPKPARKYSEWWANEPASEQTEAWLGAGWQVGAVDLAAEQVRLEHTPGEV